MRVVPSASKPTSFNKISVNLAYRFLLIVELVRFKVVLSASKAIFGINIIKHANS